MWKFLIVMILIANVTQAQGRRQIVQNGITSYSIQVDNRDSLSLAAADIIKRYTRESTGVDIPLRTAKSRQPAIVVRRIKSSKTYPTESYSLELRGQNLYIQGEGRGVIYAAYRYVRDIIGARKWYIGTANTYIPQHQNLSIESNYKIIAKPAFGFRELYFPIEMDKEYMDWYGLHNLEEKWGLWGHTFNKILPASTYFKGHPEYYSFYNGKRQPTQLCLSNEDVYKHTIAFFREQINDNPTAEYWSISPNDDIGHCECDQCKKNDQQEGGPQGSLIHFVNKVARVFPHKKFTTLAYLQTSNAPAKTHVANNVYIILSNIDANKNNSIDSEKSAATFRRQLERWREKSKHVFVWEYMTQFTHYLAPFPIQGTFEKSLRFLHNKGTKGVFLQAGGSTYSDMAELNTYILAHLVWDINLSEAQLTDEFIDGYYKTAAPYVKEYLTARQKELNTKHPQLSIYGNPIDNHRDFLSPQAMDKYSMILEQADAKIAGDKILQDRIRRMTLGLDYVHMQQARFYGPHRHGIFVKNDNKWAVRPPLEKMIKRFVDDAIRLGVQELSEEGINPEEYGKEWKKIIAEGVRINNTEGASIALHTPFDPSFPANGLHTLTDSVPGYLDYSYNWLLWHGEPMVATVQFEKVKKINTIEVNFLQDARHWIFQPQEVQIWSSKDGIEFTKILQQSAPTIEEDYSKQTIKYRATLSENMKAIRVQATPIKQLPEWRYHPKKKPLIACDEIWLE